MRRRIPRAFEVEREEVGEDRVVREVGGPAIGGEHGVVERLVRLREPHRAIVVQLGTQPRPLRGVHHALEQGSEDGRVHLAPIQPRGVLEDHEFRAGEVERWLGVEQVAVEPGDFLAVDVASLGHRGEEVGAAEFDDNLLGDAEDLL